MHHPGLSLPTSIAPGIARDTELMVSKIRTVGGREVRNREWSVPLRVFEVPFPNMQRTDPDFVAVQELWEAVNGETDSFAFFDELAGEAVAVRFEGKLRAAHVAGPWWQFDTIMLVEVRL